jgi:hypothetical protein
LVGIVDLDLLYQSPQKDARIIGGKGEEESSRGSTMVVKIVLKNHRKPLGKKGIYSGREKLAVWRSLRPPVGKSVRPELGPDVPVPGPDDRTPDRVLPVGLVWAGPESSGSRPELVPGFPVCSPVHRSWHRKLRESPKPRQLFHTNSEFSKLGLFGKLRTSSIKIDTGFPKIMKEVEIPKKERYEPP